MHESNIFLTLTYSDEHLESSRLIYPHFQNFMKSLRQHVGHEPDKRIPFMVTGEYGDKNKRPHWHALLFNFAPDDQKFSHETDRGDRIYTSNLLDELWGRNDPKTVPNQIGAVTIDSAGYVARYAAKKLTHGHDQDHDYHPIHNTSKFRAIGKAWIEKHWKHTFRNGFIVLPNGQPSKIPRYYVDWLKKQNHEEWLRYVTQIRPKIQLLAEEQSRKEELEFLSNHMSYQGGSAYPLTRPLVKHTILKSKFKQLQERLKL